jgi:hypothetical protein
MANKTESGAKLFRPWLCVTGVMFLWAAQNQPPAFTPASLAIWGLSSVAVGLIAGAIFAFVQPLILAMGRVSHDMANTRADQVAAGLANTENLPGAGTPAAGGDAP